MRDLVFKNLISQDRRRRIIASSEISDAHGMHSVIRRHFICLVKEANARAATGTLPYMRVLKEHNSKEQKKKFFCRVKGSFYFNANGRRFIALFTHSLKISLSATSQVLEKA